MMVDCVLQIYNVDDDVRLNGKHRFELKVFFLAARHLFVRRSRGEKVRWETVISSMLLIFIFIVE